MVSVLSVRVAVAVPCLLETCKRRGGRVPMGRGLADEPSTMTVWEGVEGQSQCNVTCTTLYRLKEGEGLKEGECLQSSHRLQ